MHPGACVETKPQIARFPGVIPHMWNLHFSSPAQNKDTYKIEPLIKRVIDKHTENCVNHIFNQIVNFRIGPTFIRVKYVDTFCISKRASILCDSNS